MKFVLKQLHQDANLTQETLAEQLDVSVNTIQNWERTNKISKDKQKSLHNP